MTGNSGRKAAQRKFKAVKCDVCGGTKILQRHHIDRDPTNNDPKNVQILCQECHKTDHMKDGTWGKGKVEPVVCEICGTVFQPKRNRRAVLCGNPECLKEKGRQSAVLRWG